MFLVGAQDAPADDGDVIIDISKPQRSKYAIAIPEGPGKDKTAKMVAEVASFDLGVAGWFRVLDPKSFLADLKKEGLGIDTEKWKDVGAFGVMKYEAKTSGKNVTIKFRLYEVEKGDKSVLSKTYSGSTKDARKLVHKWCNDVVKYYTGENGFFGSKIAFTAKGRKRRGGRTSKIVAMDFDGHGAYSVTRNKYINILPSWSPSGGKIAFTSYMRDNPDLYVVGAGGGRPKRVSKHYGMNTGASWSPDGSKIALTLSKDGNPEIYVIPAAGGKARRLTKSRRIDTSPAWSPDGKEIAFVSDREGGPQIFVMSASGGSAKRISMNGSYNTTPSWSPQKGKRIIAYTTSDGGNFDIVTKDLDSGTMTRITQNEGNNEEPSFAPNGRAIAFARSSGPGGSGVYLANADGTGDAVRVYKGSATSVDWGPAP